MIYNVSPGQMQNAAPATGNSTAPGSDRLRQVAQEFEALFWEMLLKQARFAARAISGDSRGAARGFYESMQNRELARAMAQGTGIGLAEMLYRRLQQDQIQTREQNTAGTGA